jgi:hypothetical protein
MTGTEHRRHERLVRHQLFHLDMQHVGLGKLLGRTVEEPAVGAFQRVGCQRRHQGIRLDEHCEPGERSLLPRRRGQALQRRPHGILHVGRHAYALVGEECRDPLQGEGDLAGLVDAGQRLQRQCSFEAQLDAGTAHGEGGGTRGSPAVEQDHLRADEAAELQGEKG